MYADFTQTTVFNLKDLTEEDMRNLREILLAYPRSVRPKIHHQAAYDNRARWARNIANVITRQLELAKLEDEELDVEDSETENANQ